VARSALEHAPRHPPCRDAAGDEAEHGAERAEQVVAEDADERPTMKLTSV